MICMKTLRSSFFLQVTQGSLYGLRPFKSRAVRQLTMLAVAAALVGLDVPIG
jgi:hypothetical protein